MGNPYVVFGAGVIINDADNLYDNLKNHDDIKSCFGLDVDNDEESIHVLRIAGETEGSSCFVGNFISRVEIGCALPIDSDLEKKQEN